MFKKGVQYKFSRFSVLYNRKRPASTVADKTVSERNVLPFSKVPRIPTIPLIGSGWTYFPIIGKYDISRLHKACLQKYYEYGPIHMDAFGAKMVFLNIYNPDDIAKVHCNEGRYPPKSLMMCIKKYRDNKKDLYNNGGLLTTNGEEWWDVRSAVQPHMMKPKSVHAYLGAMDEVAQAFTDRMDFLREKDGGEVPEYLKELFKWALESVALVTFDKRLGGLNIKPNEEAVKMINAVNTIFVQMMKIQFSIQLLWNKFPRSAYQEFEKSMDYLSAKAYQYLEEAKQRLKDAPEDHEATFLEQMMSTAKDPRDVTAMVTDMIFAGIETTSCTVGFTLYHLAHNPEVQEKLYQEIRSNVKAGPLTIQTLNDLRYLKACVKESMRCTPTIIGNIRNLAEDTVLSGYAIPAGTMIFIQLYAIGQMEKYFPEPKKFKPERFLREEAVHHPFAFLPFGYGLRMCVGRRIAEQEIWTLLTRIIQRYRVEYNYEDVDMYTKGVATPDKPLRFQFFDR